MMSTPLQVREFTVDAAQRGERLDRILAAAFPHQSRSQLQRWIATRHVLVNGEAAKPGQRLRGGEHVVVREAAPVPAALEPEPMPLDVVYEDEDVIVVNKPPGMVVHPAPGHSSGTLVHALLAYRSHWSSIGGVERPGIVHRLDKGTSGLLAVACNDRSHQHLAAQLSKRTMKRVYHALVWGQMKAARGTVDKPIGRHPTKRKQMAVVEDGGRRAATHFRLLDQFPNSSLLEVRLETGRTHQVRVHLASLHHGVVGDTTYARSAAPLRDRSGNALPATAFSRPLLHAVELSFTHPRRGALVHCSAPVPLDFRTVLERLRRSRMPPASE